MVVIVKNTDSPEKIMKKLQAVETEQTAKRIERLKPFFGVLKRNIDPLKLQKKWRNEWE
jgi:7,8-dihydro-6-hydroxymethylpterin-pyrophosphokinase